METATYRGCAAPRGEKNSFKSGKCVEVFFVQPGSTGNGDAAQISRADQELGNDASRPAGLRAIY
jgi:hypothetical protein